ncbi:alpha/beta hydrolase [Falsiruegeria mediterranea]|uniref:Uncharacterized protein n=1 Tax=Falsiruegeria mediterranea M17 TaxID=1200281 RepID=A0A2R8CES5_9RHOB|nr:hypothetical protein [Falsiruegeria mediterranea]SPJ30953.1 hypothetical protein TRM7615_04490 [Falsiruegeria mediterranea M17]
MTKSLPQSLHRRLMAGVAGLAFCAVGTVGAAAADGLNNAEAEPKYAVGVAANFVRDFSKPFDAWGRKYKSDEYRAWLDEVDASGTPRTTVTRIYYPTAKGQGVAKGRAATTVPSPLPAAAEGEQISVAGLFLGDQDFAEMAFSTYGPQPVVEGIYQAYENAPVAEGAFPLIVMVHGLGGSIHTWASAAEYLAAQGYIVVTVALTSESGASPVFHDPDSAWAKGKSLDEIIGAYQLRVANSYSTVFANFFKYLYQFEGPVSFENMPDPSDLTPTPEGALRSGQLMADLFNQRVEDVASVIAEMKFLNAPKTECEVGLVQAGSSEPLCGMFTEHVDVEHVGVMGHSLGSMTAQAAAAFLGDVDTAVGFNNGMPRLWEPYGGIPCNPEEGRPAGVQKPFLQVIGSDDFFVHNVFRGIHGNLYRAAGGDPADNYPLADEQPWPTKDNPQPVARSAFNRATAEKMLVMFRDQGHGHTTDDQEGAFTPGHPLQGMRLPSTPDAAPEPYQIMGWIKDGKNDVYLPHLMRNYYLTNWFDWTLKGDEQARAALVNHPFDQGVQHLLEEGVSN